MEDKMFCFQCQETAGNKGCTKGGVCGKKPETAGLQDLLIYVTKGLSAVTTRMRDEGKEVPRDVDHMVTENLFTTITNANFDDAAIKERITETLYEKEKLLHQIDSRDNLPEAAEWNGPEEAYEEKAASDEVGVLATVDEDIRSLRELITYGLKGLAAYTKHANVLGKEDPDVDAFVQKALAQTLDDTMTASEYINLTLETGKNGVQGMADLDEANTSAYGNPIISEVNIGTRNNPGILISGHDLKDLEMLLEQTQGTGVDVYTHSEMLPGNYYPAFRKYDNLVGNYGNAWWKQREEFTSFHGPILMTTNCIVPPTANSTYKDKMFTTGAAGFPGCKHIEADENGHKDFSEIIELAKKCEAPEQIEEGTIVGGFAHAQTLSLADKIVENIKNGSIKKFIVMAGCDGRMKSRDYYTEFAKALPKDTIILTAGCAKYKYNKLNLGDINGIPRVLDAGQCNDSFSLVMIAMALKDVFGLDDINDLPIEFNIAWYEQKAVIVLLALLSLGVKNIHLGPTLPAFLSPTVAQVLVDTFGIAGIGTVEDDIKLFTAEKETKADAAEETADDASAEGPVTSDMLVGEILAQFPETAEALMNCGMHCLGCPSSQMESLRDACYVHGLDVNAVLKAVNDAVGK